MSTEPTLEHFADDGTFPNSELPLVIYRAALGGGPGDAVGPEAMEGLFAGNGWPPQWRAGIYAFPHYHSTSHECLGVASGRATLMFGGREKNGSWLLLNGKHEGAHRSLGDGSIGTPVRNLLGRSCYAKMTGKTFALNVSIATRRRNREGTNTGPARLPPV